MVHELLQHTDRQHRRPGDSFRWNCRAGLSTTARNVRTRLFGAPIGAIMGKYAIGEAPAGSTGINLSVLLALRIGKVLGWRLRGQDLAAPVLPVEDARADLSADRAAA